MYPTVKPLRIVAPTSLQGNLDAQTLPTSPTPARAMKCHLAPVFLVLKGRKPPCRCGQLIDNSPPHRRAVPRPDAELQRQHRDILRQAALGEPPPRPRHATEPPPSSAPARRRSTTDTAVPGLGDGHPPARPARTIPLPR